MAREALERRLRDRLAELEASGLRRKLPGVSGFDFCSNDYLGLSKNPLIKERMIQSVAREGCGSTGSRLIRGDNCAFGDVERSFAEFKATEGSLFFSSGYLANLAVLTTFLESSDIVFSDRLNHASLIDGIRLSKARCVVFPHCDVANLRSLIEKETMTEHRFILTESIFSMDGDEAPLTEYASLCRETGSSLIVDEAHAVGLYGVHGTGLIEARGVDEDVFLSINSAGKALGVAGAFVAGSGLAIDYLVQNARPFIFSTAAPPSVPAAIDKALEVVQREPELRERLFANATLLRQILTDNDIPVAPGTSQILLVLIGDNDRAMRVAKSVYDQGFDVRAIRPPTVPEGSARLRITVNATHNKLVLQDFVQALRRSLDWEK